MKRLIWVILFTFYTIVLSAKVYDLVNPSGKLKLQIEVLDNISWTFYLTIGCQCHLLMEESWATLQR